ncbi:hypothetical protein SAMN05216411_10345 [Nitrosospira multiformis]|nr:hypothetical protein SAMN05216411_10345 [Nitrosospira multiformis]
MDSEATAFLLSDGRFILFMKDRVKQNADHHSIFRYFRFFTEFSCRLFQFYVARLVCYAGSRRWLR